MHFLKFFALVVIQVASTRAVALKRRDPPVFTGLDIYHTIIDEYPYIVDATSTVVWTQSPTITDTSLPTTEPTPTIVY
ncbi:hypothetical protein HYPSUDRAFT_215523 [Hypholoma sublateritium FD-334 SS-4]|uniref:Uncharacterized protein n=1 Tax=Hypholoma sublateritium (strain FD-334 SS-4) TaxID=945553 RepID=A0A0D2NVC7_HYPSF|nr:hypothetical protein HYPSUDRAFT_215523 [Hypholoma sublateritium FD-334 SS-4]